MVNQERDNLLKQLYRGSEVALANCEGCFPSRKGDAFLGNERTGIDFGSYKQRRDSPPFLSMLCHPEKGSPPRIARQGARMKIHRSHLRDGEKFRAKDLLVIGDNELGVPSTLIPSLEQQEQSFKEELHHIRKLNSDLLLEELRAIALHQDNDFIPTMAYGIEWKGVRFSKYRQILEDLERAPEDVKERLLNCVEEY